MQVNRRMFMATGVAATGAVAVPAWAQLRIEITGVGANQFPIAIPQFQGTHNSPVDIASVITADLERSGAFRAIKVMGEIPAEDLKKPRGPFWQTMGANALVVGTIEAITETRFATTLRLFDTVKGTVLTEKRYVVDKADLRLTAHQMADDIYEKITADGKALGSYAHSKDNRIYVNYEDLSPDLVRALIATEDVRFAEHSGIDAQGLFRAVVKRGILMQKSGGGGSTITQQLAKLLFSPSVDNMMERLFQKPIEWVIAVQLERYYTKEEIINMYLNKFDFLYNAVGIQSAARVYFGKTPKTLSIEEAATLVGMCKNPSYFNPVRHNERTLGRRNTVLRQMEKAGYLSKADCDSLCALPLTLHFTRMDHKDGLAPYFREYLRLTLTAKKPNRKDYASWQAQKFSEDSLSWETNPLYGWCNKNKKADGEFYNLYTDGLKIYTTIDSRMQRYAEEAVREHMSKDLQPAFFKEKKGRSYAPFSKDVSAGQIDTMLMRAMHQTDRYRAMKKGGMSEQEMRKEFEKPVEMRVFSWNGPIDTLLSPMDSIRYHKSFLRTAFMSMEARTGHVKAYVGGIDYNNFQYDMVNGGRRQVGSTMKPFLYSLAMIEGISPCDQMLHVQQQLMDENGRLWVPRNASAKRVGEMVTIKWGLQNSDNWVTAYLMSQLSPYTFVRLLHSFGLKNEIDPVISVCLGTPDVSVGEMVGAYTVFANHGIRVEPQYVTLIIGRFL